jgi:hypothetical protein
VTEVSAQIDISYATMALWMTLPRLKLLQVWQTSSSTRTMQRTGRRESVTEVGAQIDIPPEPSADGSVSCHAVAGLADFELDPDHAENRPPRERDRGKRSD